MAAEQSLGLRTANRAVADQLREEIERGLLTPGARLRQTEVAKRLGVSTTPVREALASLEAEGLLRTDPHRGTVVASPSRQDFENCFEIRIALEPLALASSLQHTMDADFDRLQTMIDEMRLLEDHVAWVVLNDEFHEGLYQHCPNERLLNMIVTLRKASRYYIHSFVVKNLRSHTADDEHQAILDACRERSVGAAQESLRVHLRRTLRGVPLNPT